MNELAGEVKKLIALDNAIANLKEAGLSEAFIQALEKDPGLMKAVEKMAPKAVMAARPGWSCCITVSRPL